MNGKLKTDWYFDKDRPFFETLAEAIEESQMIIVFVDRAASVYGPIYGFSKKLKEIDIERLAAGQINMDRKEA